MTRARDLLDACLAAVILAVFDVVAWALNRYTLKEPW